jgi:LPXTG-motif cell wall-anchored protein
VASDGTVQRATVSPQGMATLKGSANKPLAFPATTAGPVTVTTASPFLVTLNWYVTKVTPATGQSLPAGIPAVDTTKPYGTSTVTCTGNPVIPWGTVQIVKTSAQAGKPGALASTGSATENLGVIGGWVLVVGVTVTFFARRRRPV